MCELTSSFVLRGTFIDEVMQKAPSMQRSNSDPCIDGHSSLSSLWRGREQDYAARLEAKYVATLEEKARQLRSPASKSKTPDSLEAATEGKLVRTCSASSAASVSSTICPESRRHTMSNSSTAKSTPFTSEETNGTYTSFSSDVHFSESKGEAKSPEGKASEAWSVGSLGHPQLCNRPCIQFSRGVCADGRDCNFCHMAHGSRTPHLDKRHRELLLRLSFGQRAAVAVPILKRQAARLGLTSEAQPLVSALELVGRQATWDAKMRREVTSLTSALGVLSFRSLMTAVCKAADTPDWLKAEDALDIQLEKIRSGGSSQRACARC